jgi:hypothetical protein
MLHFCFSTIDGLAKLGIVQSKDEQEATFMSWKTVAFLLGVREDLQARDLADGRLLLETSYKRHFDPNDEAAALIKEELGVVYEILPWGLEKVPAALMRYLMGKKTSDLMKVPNPILILWFFRLTSWLWKDHKLFMRMAEWLSPKLIRWLDDNRKLTSQLKIKV